MNLIHKRSVRLLIMVVSFALLPVSTIHASDYWFLNNPNTFSEDQFCWAKSDKPTLQVKQVGGKWESTRAVPIFTKATREICESQKEPFELSFRFKPKDLGVKIPVTKKVAAVNFRVIFSEGKTKPTKIGIWRSKQDYQQSRKEAINGFLGALETVIEKPNVLDELVKCGKTSCS